MKFRNPIIVLTNFLLLGIFCGGVLAWLISSLWERDSTLHSLAFHEIVVTESDSHIVGKLAGALNGSTADADSDGIPDQWEVEHSLDPTNPDDALSDFDNDGLTALHLSLIHI